MDQARVEGVAKEFPIAAFRELLEAALILRNKARLTRALPQNRCESSFFEAPKI